MTMVRVFFYRLKVLRLGCSCCGEQTNGMRVTKTFSGDFNIMISIA